MNNKIRFVMIPYNGMMLNVTSNLKTIVEISSSKKSLFYGFYNDDNMRGNMIFIYGRRLVENDECKINKFELPSKIKFSFNETTTKIYGDLFLFMYNSNNYMYEDFTKDMMNRISIKK